VRGVMVAGREITCTSGRSSSRSIATYLTCHACAGQGAGLRVVCVDVLTVMCA
jgi:hypothetical protein